MLRVNLNVLLAERSLTASKVSKDTGISKTTLSSLVNNSGKGIQYDTLDTLCNYLNVTPNDFFDFIPFDYSLFFYLDKVDIKLKSNDDSQSSVLNASYRFDFHIDTTINKRRKSYELLGELDFQGVNHIKFKNNYLISLKFINDEVEDFKESFYNKMSAGHRAAFNEKVKKTIANNFYKDVLKGAVSYDSKNNIISEDNETEVKSGDIFLNTTDITGVTDWNYTFHI